MLTDNKIITTKLYWNNIYMGNNNNAKVDASNTKRPANAFDRFGWVAKYAEGPNVLGIASGHAHIEKRIKALHPSWYVVASDQAEHAKVVANFEPYGIFSAYEIPHPDKKIDTIICAQALEYMDDIPRFFNEAKRVAHWLLITVPIGEMKAWSQLYIFTEVEIFKLVIVVGEITHKERKGDLLLLKVKLDD